MIIKSIFNKFPEYINKNVISILFVMIFLFILLTDFLTQNGQQFSELANSFLHLKPYFLHSIGGVGQDPILYRGKIYWGEGLFPAIVLMPFVLLFNSLHLFFYQGFLQWVLVIITLIIIKKMAVKIGFSNKDSLFLAFVFLLGTVYIGVASVSSSWFFAQVITTLLIFLTLYEFLHRKRWWLLGILSGLLFITRATAAGIIVFLLLELFSERRSNSRLKLAVQLLLPFGIAILLTGLYNFVRFNNPFNGGYLYQDISTISAASRSIGLFSLKHIPFNLYHALFGTPVISTATNSSWQAIYPFIKNNPYGLSIFITSPFLLYIFYQKKSAFKSNQIKNLIITAIIIAIAVFSYYGVGIYQYGYRYSLDFLPELFLIFLLLYKQRHKNLSFGFKVLASTSIILNFYLLLTFL